MFMNDYFRLGMRFVILAVEVADSIYNFTCDELAVRQLCSHTDCETNKDLTRLTESDYGSQAGQLRYI